MKQIVDLSSSGDHKNGQTTYFLNCKVGFRFDCEISSSVDVLICNSKLFLQLFPLHDYTGIAQQEFLSGGKGGLSECSIFRCFASAAVVVLLQEITGVSRLAQFDVCQWTKIDMCSVYQLYFYLKRMRKHETTTSIVRAGHVKR